jgi:hypothetical protein
LLLDTKFVGDVRLRSSTPSTTDTQKCGNEI